MPKRTSGLSVTVKEVREDVLYLIVNGKEYGYKPTDLEMTAVQLRLKFDYMAGFSTGRAFAWLKKNSDQVSPEPT